MRIAGRATVEREIERRIALRLGGLRAERGFTLAQLARATGISRATLSRIERGELSPSAGMLSRLCAVYRWTLSRLMADAEARPPSVVARKDQDVWRDPETGYRRRALSPPAPGLLGELVEVRLPARASVFFDMPPAGGPEHHLWILEGALMLELEGAVFRLKTGDCLRYVQSGAARVEAIGKRAARYVVAIVQP